MKVAVLTTQTIHHAYFVRELAADRRDVRVFCEDRVIAAPFETGHPFELQRDAFESEIWFGGARPAMEKFAVVSHFESMNEGVAIRSLSDWGADVVIVFGTGRLSQAVIEAGPRCFLNLHGGNPEQYRGLDSHLWAIYHNDFGALTTALHHVNAKLDDGDICFLEDVAIAKEMPLHALRRANSETCVRLARAALATFDALGDVPRSRQVQKGRYYSFMPSVLKEVCRKKFEKHTKDYTFRVVN